ncbi:MAG TPA: RecQ family zinc-binding domain-containing protein [Flavobacteriales bacterium]|nr:RecQ family zinc-binding domain-containing protein [Flavobacteriales bacterium]
MATVLDYFGERSDGACGRCDACKRAGRNAGGPEGASTVAAEPLSAYQRITAAERALRDEYGDGPTSA